MKTILVTGGAGFLGSHLCEFLLKKEEQVICVDDLSTGSKNNIKHLIEDKNFEFVEHDIIEPIQIEKKIDEIYNLACPASPPRYQADPIKTIKICTVGVMNVLELAKKNKARILQASTSEVYGNPTEHPQKEDYRGNINPIGPRACYDEGKRIAETLFFDYQRRHNLNIKVVRIFNTYGPHMDKNDGRVVSNFIVQALTNHPLTVYGNGTQTRSFCYVSDLIKGMHAMMNSTSKGPINLGNPTELTILEIAEKIINLTNSKSTIVFKPLPQDDPHQRKPDISLAKKELSWQPVVSLDEGLKKTIKYFRELQR